jgi:hypothetical protein
MSRPRLIAPVLLLALSLLQPACVEEHDKDGGDAPFTLWLSPGGKADDAGLLSAADLARVQAAFDDAIASGEAAIATLEHEIDRLDAENRAKVGEIDGLVRQMEQRRSELEDQHRRNLVLCLLFPSPGICLLAVVIENDGRMQQLERDLAQARDRQRQVQAELADHRDRRAVLQARLAPLRAARERLIALYRDGVPLRPLPEVLDAGSPEALAFSRADALGRIAAATRAEIELLVEIRNAAAELQAQLDAALGTIRALASSVDALVAEARDRFMELLEALTSGDPDAVARDWLDEAIAARTRAMLDALDWPARELIDHLIATRPGDEVDLDQLARDLLDQLLAGEAHAFTSTVALALLDHTEAVSAIAVPAGVGATTAEITVRIEHSYIGDLQIRVQHAGFQRTLHDRLGGGADDLFATYVVELPAGLATAGTWRLLVADRADGDQGRLLGWDLVLR